MPSNYAIMKNRILISMLLFLFTVNLQLNAASFTKNDKIIEAGFGLGIYDISTYQKSMNIRENDKAAAWVYPFSFEYGIANRLAIGLGYKYSNFILGNEDSLNTNRKVKGNDLVFKPTLHLIKRKRINVYLGALAGLSWFNFQVNDNLQSYAKGDGTLLALILGTRFYFSKNIGLSLHYTFNNYKFVDLTLANNVGNTDKLDLTLKRGNVGLGLVLKFN